MQRLRTALLAIALAALATLGHPAGVRAESGTFVSEDGVPCAWIGTGAGPYRITCDGYSHRSGARIRWACEWHARDDATVEWSCRDDEGHSWKVAR